MIGKLAYYGLIIPISYLPLPVLYFLTDIFYLLLITVIPYRRSVVRRNIEFSFPEKSQRERRKIERGFYRYLTDLLAESTKNLTISKRYLIKRFVISNPEVMDKLYANSQNVLLVSGHYNNWEYFLTAQDLLFKHKAVGVGKPLTNPFWDKKINARRERFGMQVIHRKNFDVRFQNLISAKEPFATLLLVDQSTADSLKSFWTTFLNQPTAVIYGPEMLAVKHNFPVVFFHTEKIKRGKYKVYLQIVTTTPRATDWGEITTTHVKMMEKVIKDNPERWLWSHKRWKREIPEKLDALKAKQRQKFNTLKDSFDV
ncbi:MAG: lysophospholipid acyltransferase family protein [Lishizhenia sp.]